WLRLPLRPLPALALVRRDIARRARRGAARPLRLPPLRAVAPALRGRRGIGALSQRVRRRGAGLPEARLPPTVGTDAVGGAVPGRPACRAGAVRRPRRPRRHQVQARGGRPGLASRPSSGYMLVAATAP